MDINRRSGLARPARNPWPYRFSPWLVALASFLPLLVWYRVFAGQFWFGDDLDMIDQIDRHGYWRWLWMPFGENFVPVYKLVWGAVVLLSGSYRVMLAIVWANHALNAALLSTLLNRAGLSRIASAFAALVFGLASANFETLCWSVQWSPVLAATFFLLAALWYQSRVLPGASWGWKTHGVLFLLLAASALSFSRGVITSLSFAAMALLPWNGRGILTGFGRRLACAAVYAIPGLLVLWIMMHLTGGNHRHLSTTHFSEVLRFAVYYFSLNPLRGLLEFDSFGWLTVFALGTLKIGLVVHGVFRAKGGLRWLFVLLALFDLGNSAVVAFGRYNMGLETCISSRYQFASSLALLPFGVFALSCALAPLWIRRPAAGRLAMVGLLALAAFAVSRNWGREAEVWKKATADETRRVLFEDPSPPPLGAIPGIDSMPTERAKELAKRYELR